jgi:tetratricopeptide (TPR) repeat protein
MLVGSDASTRRSAAFVLSKIEIPGREKFIHQLLQDENFGVRKMALKAALELESNVGVREIAPLLDDSNQWVRKQAVECACRIEDFSATSILEMLSKEESPAVVESLLKFVVERELSSATGLIFERIRREPDEEMPWLIASLGHLGAIEELGKVKKFLGPIRAEVFAEYYQALLLNGEIGVFEELGKMFADKKRDAELISWARISGEIGSFATRPEKYSKTMYQVLLEEVQKDIDGITIMAEPVAETSIEEAEELHDSGEFGKARDLLEKLRVKFADDARVNFLYASCCYNLGEAGKAQTLLEKMQKEHPGNIDAAVLLGQIFFRKKEWGKLVECYERIVGQIDDNDRRNVIRVFGALGLAYFHEKIYDKAIAALKRGLKANPRDLSSSYHLALCYYAVGENEKARKILESLRKTLPSDSKVLKNVIELLQRM